jgi:lipoate-protein ligase A
VTAWTLLEAGDLTPAANMALDLGVLSASLAGQRPDPVLRVYGWHPPTVSVGAKVDLPEDVRRRCTAAGVDVVQRATGGGCVLHDRDVTYSVVAPVAGRSVLEAYRWVAGGLIAGLRLLGIEATVAEHPAVGRPLDCFAVATGADLEVEGRKICGSAQVRRRGWFLQHGSLPIVDIREKMATLLGDSTDRTSTCVEESRPGTTWSETASALIAGFAIAWGAEPCRRRPERFEWGSGGEAPQYRGVPEGPRAAAFFAKPSRYGLD